MAGQVTFTIYPVVNYSFGTKAAKQDKDATPQDRLARMEEQYRRLGQRRTVDAVLLVYEHNHPHVLLLQGASGSFFKLPGGRLRPGEDEITGLRRKLDAHLAPGTASMRAEWQIGECIGVWYRSHFDAFMYPYQPPHIARPREVKRVYVVPLQDRQYFAIPKNFKLLAVPLFELYDNLHRYGPVLAAIPTMISRYRLTLGAAIAVPRAMPDPQQDAQQQAQQYAQQQMVAYQQY